LLKVDFGVHIDGWTADNAFSVDLENSEENKKLIKASEEALQKALELIKKRLDVNNDKSDNKFGVTEKRGDKINDVVNSKNHIPGGGGGVDGGINVNEIGSAIQKTIESHGFSPIINLCGHSMKQYELHGGITIPNIDDGRGLQIKEGLYAIEPFVTPGSGKVRDGKPSGIYELISEKKPRSELARQVLAFIEKEYNTLPFCSRWLVKKLGLNSTLALRELEANGSLHHFSQLIEVSGAKVSQAEHTILIEKDKVTVTTI